MFPTSPGLIAVFPTCLRPAVLAQRHDGGRGFVAVVAQPRHVAGHRRPTARAEKIIPRISDSVITSVVLNSYCSLDVSSQIR